jgi:NADH dehydrogenase
MHYDIGQYLNALRRSPVPALTVRVPAWLVRLCAHALDVMHWTPLSFGHVELLRRDNLPRSGDANALRFWLGRMPRPVGTSRESASPDLPELA